MSEWEKVGIGFAFEPNAKINKLTIGQSKEKTGTAITVKVAGAAPGSVIAGILAGPIDDAALFWDTTADTQPPIFSGEVEVTSAALFEDRRVKIDKRTFESATLRKFQLKPIANGLVELACEIVIDDIVGADISYLCQRYRREVPIVVETPVDLFNQGGADDGEEPT